MPDLIANFDRVEKKITQYVISRAEDYFGAVAFTSLKKRHSDLTNSYNLNISSRNNSNSKLAFPIQLEGALLRRASLKAAIRGEPLISLEPTFDTPYDNALLAQDTLSQNYNRTLYRRRTLAGVCNTVAKYGSAIVVAQPQIKTANKTRTVMGAMYPERQRTTEETTVVENNQVHLLNYFQDPSINNSYDSPFWGHIQRFTQASLAGHIMQFKENYLRKNVVKLFEIVKNGNLKNQHYHETNKYDQGNGIDVLCYCGTLPIEGNENDETTYYLELSADLIIRIQEGMRNYSHFYLDKRDDYWWANTDVEYTRSHEYLFNLIMNMKADNVVNDIMRLVFYPKNKGGFDIADINNRFKTGGWIGYDYDGRTPASQLINQWQQTDSSTPGLDFLTREVKESVSRMRTGVDLQRNPSQGGPSNKTAYGASIMATQSDVRESDLLGSFEDGLLDNAQVNIEYLQEVLPDIFQVRPKANRPGREVFKEQILGTFAPGWKSSLEKTKESETVRVINGINTLVNLMGTGLPVFQKINLEKPVRNLVRQVDLGDQDEIMPEDFSKDLVAGAPTMVPKGEPMPPELMPVNPGMARAA